MRRESIFSVLVASALLFAAVACEGKETGDTDPDQKPPTKPTEKAVAYEGPQSPGDAEWSLRSLNGRDAAEGSNVSLLFPVKGELGVNGGCLGFTLYHELKGDGLRIVQPGLQVGRPECGKPEAAKRQAGGILEVVRDLAEVRIGEGRLELRSGAGEVAVFERPPPAEVDPALVGTEWLLTELEGEPPLPKAPATLEIGKEVLRGNTGCNYYGGEIDAMDDGTIVWKNADTAFDMTLVGCSEDVLDQENAYLDALAAVETYRVEGDRLRMANSGGQTMLVFEQKVQWWSNPARLVGTSWVLRPTDGRDPVRGSVPTVRFGSGEEISYYDGCRDFEGRYIATENDLSVPELGVVGGQCMKPEAFMASDGPCIVGCFSPEGDYRLRDGLLEIRPETGETTSIFEPIPKGEELKREGTPWELRVFVEDGEQTAVVGEAPITLAFDRGTLRREGTIFGSTGCNDYRATYEYPTVRNTPERIEVGEPVVTRRSCPKSSRLSEQEERFLSVLGDLGDHPDVSVGCRLTLDTGYGRKLIFSAPDRTGRRPT